MELKRIEKLIDLLRDKEVGELEYSEWEGEKGFNVRVSMVGEQVVVAQAGAPVAAPVSAGDLASTDAIPPNIPISPCIPLTSPPNAGPNDCSNPVSIDWN